MEDSQSNNTSKTQQCDSLIIASKYDPTATLFALLPYLAPSSPFVVYHEFLEPLLETFRTLQNYCVSNNNNGSDENTNTTTSPNGVGTIATTTTPMMLRHNIAIN